MIKPLEKFQLPNFDLETDISELDSTSAIDAFELMLLIRKSEERIALGRKLGDIGGPVHLAAGQEAIPVGISKFLTPTDSVFSAHRSHAHLLALTKNPYRLFAEVLGRVTGHSNGYGGSMHLWAGDVGFRGSVPIVAGTVPLALGTAMASKMRGEKSISIAYFGDGAMEEGVVHESLNLARLLSLPILFVCENNFFSSHMHISQRQPSIFNARFAEANCINFKIVDGNNIGDVSKTAKEAIEKIRSSGGPFFIEAFTYRLFGHVDWREDIDVGLHRSSNELMNWRNRDPIERLKSKLLKLKLLKPHEFDSIESKVADTINKSWNQALADPEPDTDLLTKYVYRESKE